MGQSLAKIYMHIAFSTKHREQLIFPPVEAALHKYMASICDNMECPAIQVGGYTDHVHVFCRLSKNIALAQLVREIKSNSSSWMKTQGPALSQFFWQTGYGAFSVSPYRANHTIKYIERQHEHHQHESYKDEMRYHMRLNEMELDEKHFWD